MRRVPDMPILVALVLLGAILLFAIVRFTPALQEVLMPRVAEGAEITLTYSETIEYQFRTTEREMVEQLRKKGCKKTRTVAFMVNDKDFQVVVECVVKGRAAP